MPMVMSRSQEELELVLLVVVVLVISINKEGSVGFVQREEPEMGGRERMKKIV